MTLMDSNDFALDLYCDEDKSYIHSSSTKAISYSIIVHYIRQIFMFFFYHSYSCMFFYLFMTFIYSNEYQKILIQVYLNILRLKIEMVCCRTRMHCVSRRTEYVRSWNQNGNCKRTM